MILKQDKKFQKAQKYLDLLTKDFETDPNPPVVWVDQGNGYKWYQEFRVEVPEHLMINHPYIVFVIFVYLKKYMFRGKFEKIAWEIPVKFKGISLLLTHRKFGFHVILWEKNLESEKIALLALSQIHKTFRYAEILVEPYIKELVKEGAITLNNEYKEIRNRCIYFRERAIQEFEITPQKLKQFNLEYKTIPEFVRKWDQLSRIKNAGNYNFIGMLDAYFSLLEHTFVLLLPFIQHIKMEEIEIEKFIGESWKGKFKTIFPIGSDITALQVLEQLDRIKEEYRNPMSHGHFQKQGLSFYVHMKYLGAIPLTLTKNERRLGYHFDTNIKKTFDEICKYFDECDTLLNTSSWTRYGMKYINSELSIAFDKNTNLIYKKSMTSMRRLINLLKRWAKNMRTREIWIGNSDLPSLTCSE